MPDGPSAPILHPYKGGRAFGAGREVLAYVRDLGPAGFGFTVLAGAYAASAFRTGFASMAEARDAALPLISGAGRTVHNETVEGFPSAAATGRALGGLEELGQRVVLGGSLRRGDVVPALGRHAEVGQQLVRLGARLAERHERRVGLGRPARAGDGQPVPLEPGRGLAL